MAIKIADLKHGTKVVAIIDNGQDTPAKITRVGDRLFLCQNVIAGASCDEKHGYRYSWSLGMYEDMINNSNDGYLRSDSVIKKVCLAEPPDWDEEANL